MRIGAHVKTSGGLRTGIARGTEMGATAIQIFTQSPRAWRPTRHDPAALAEYRELEAQSEIAGATFCHATYLINLATSDPELLARSRACLTENLRVATSIGSAGVVLHLGSHLGAGLDAVLDQMAAALRAALDDVEAELSSTSSPILIENAAGAGGTVGRSLDELAIVLGAADGDTRLGICLDTQHLFASGVEYSSLEAADAVVETFDRTLGLERLRLIHLNDSKVALGANRDRHENVGEGEIGAEALGLLISAPQLDHVAVVLEVPGAGDGPRAEDVVSANSAYSAGRSARD